MLSETLHPLASRGKASESKTMRISNRAAVMRLGPPCELANTATLYQRPRHPYTRAGRGNIRILIHS
jgi:ABC-type oligopeptide transport system ATPase subunit